MKIHSMSKNDKQKKTELIDNILKLYTTDLEECTLEELEDVVSFFHYKAQLTEPHEIRQGVTH